jgi:hypothetical protein
LWNSNQGICVIVCEYFFKEFYSQGSDEYLYAWAREVDVLADEGWKVLDSVRQPRHPGYWTTVLGRPVQEFQRERVGGAFAEGEE